MKLVEEFAERESRFSALVGTHVQKLRTDAAVSVSNLAEMIGKDAVDISNMEEGHWDFDLLLRVLEKLPQQDSKSSMSLKSFFSNLAEREGTKLPDTFLVNDADAIAKEYKEAHWNSPT